MLSSALRLACLAAVVAAPIMGPAESHIGRHVAAGRTPEPRLNAEEAQEAANSVLSDLSDQGDAIQLHLSAKGDVIQQGILDATDPAQIDPDDVTQLITSHPAVPEEHDEAIGAAVTDLHGHLTTLHGHGFVPPGEGRWATGLADFIDTALEWFEKHLEPPLNSAIDAIGEELGVDLSFIVPYVKSYYAYLADLLGSAAIFLKSPSLDSAKEGLTSAIESPLPDVMSFLRGSVALSDCQ